MSLNNNHPSLPAENLVLEAGHRDSLMKTCSSFSFLIEREQEAQFLGSNVRIPRHARRAFTFTEVLFAVIILGIGFIMIAAVFPVALKETMSSGEETVASTIAKEGVACMSTIALVTDPNQPLPAPPNPPLSYLYPQVGATGLGTTNASGDFWNALSGNLILPSDPRYAWIPLYRRDMNNSYAQIIIIGCKARGRSNFAAVDLKGVSTYVPNLQARPVKVTITRGNPPAADTIVFAPNGGSDYTPAVAEGSFVVIANDPGPQPPPRGPNALPINVSTDGYIYRVGNNVSNGGATWELMPGNDTATPPTYFPQGQVPAFIVGRSYADPANPSLGFSGPAMDIAAYTTFLRAN